MKKEEVSFIKKFFKVLKEASYLSKAVINYFGKYPGFVDFLLNLQNIKDEELFLLNLQLIEIFINTNNIILSKQ